MRRSLSACRSGLSVAAALVLLTACGGSDEENSASDAASTAPETTASESTASETAAEPVDSEFCTQAASIQERLEATVSGVTDPTQLPQVMQEAAEEIHSIDAPDEIAADWNALADGSQRFADAIADIDFQDPNALATLQERLTPLQEELDTASTNVTDYLRDECGIDPSAGTGSSGG